MTADQLKKRLGQLERQAAEAKVAWRSARDALREDQTTTHRLFAPLRSLGCRPATDDVRRVSAQIAQRIIDGRLVLVPLDPFRPAAGVRASDPERAEREESARVAAQRAQERLDHFRTNHAEELLRVDELNRVRAVRDAVAGDDLPALQDALAAIGTRQTRPTAFTTDDLTTPRSRTVVTPEGPIRRAPVQGTAA
jgi:hypothetical protein